MDPDEYETFLESLKKEKQLRESIKQFKRYRKNGLKKLEGKVLLKCRSACKCCQVNDFFNFAPLRIILSFAELCCTHTVIV